MDINVETCAGSYSGNVQKTESLANAGNRMKPISILPPFSCIILSPYFICDACIYRILFLSLLGWSAAQSLAASLSHSLTQPRSLRAFQPDLSYGHTALEPSLYVISLQFCRVGCFFYPSYSSAKSCRHPVVTLQDWPQFSSSSTITTASSSVVTISSVMT